MTIFSGIVHLISQWFILQTNHFLIIHLKITNSTIKWSSCCRIDCTPDRIRTCDIRLRRQMLYPAELRDLIKNPCKSISYKGLSGETGIRTQATLSRWQISNLLHYHSGTSPKRFTNLAKKMTWKRIIYSCWSNKFLISTYPGLSPKVP